MHHHIAGEIEPDDSATRKIFQKKASQFSCPATRIEYAFIAAQVQVVEDALSPLKLRRGEAMVFGGVPFAGLG